MSTRKNPFIALKFRDFRLYWFGTWISIIGTQMQTVAVAWQLYQITHSPVSLGLAGVVSFLPILFFSLLGGLIADIVDRKKLLIYSQLFMGFVAFLFAYFTFTGTMTIWMIYLLLFLNTCASTFSGPARQSIIPTLVPKDYLMNAISLSTLTRHSAVVLGPAIAGFIIEYYTVGGIYFFNTATFVLMVLALIPVNYVVKEENPTVKLKVSAVLEGLRFVKQSPVLFAAMLLDFFANFFSSATALLPIFATDILHTGAQGLGVLYAAPSIGGILAGLALSAFHDLRNQGKILVGGVLLYGVATIGFGLSSTLPLTILFLALVGAGDMVSTIIRSTSRQLLTPDYLRGRMVSINSIFIQGGPKLGDAESGLVAAWIGAPLSVVVGGVGSIVSTFLIVKRFPQIWKYDSHHNESVKTLGK